MTLKSRLYFQECLDLMNIYKLIQVRLNKNNMKLPHFCKINSDSENKNQKNIHSVTKHLP